MGRCHNSVEFGPGWAMKVGYPEPCPPYSPCWGKKEGTQNSSIFTAGAGTTLRMRKNLSYKKKRQ